MRVIPVMDLKSGQVVLGAQGNRRAYRPVSAPLCPESDILAVARAFLSVYPFDIFYIADLDAIEGQGDNNPLIVQLLETCPGISLWIDSGRQAFIETIRPAFRKRVCTVLGSETGLSVAQLSRAARDSAYILSLDFNHTGFIGDACLLEQPAALPQRLILMSLPCVGAHAGPDLERLRRLRRTMPDKHIHVAGGVRDATDLRQLGELGAHGALLATALHNKTVTSKDLQ